MARKQNNYTGALQQVSELSPSIWTLIMMLIFFFISGAIFSVIAGVFGWIPFIGGIITGVIFGTINAGVLFLGMLMVLAVERSSSGSWSKAFFAFVLFLIFDILPYNYIYPIILLVIKLLAGTKK